MDRTPVTSENIKEIGYDPRLSILEIEFHSGGTYQYFDVPENVHQALLNASSHGKFFDDYIRYSYRYQKKY